MSLFPWAIPMEIKYGKTPKQVGGGKSIRKNNAEYEIGLKLKISPLTKFEVCLLCFFAFNSSKEIFS